MLLEICLLSNILIHHLKLEKLFSSTISKELYISLNCSTISKELYILKCVIFFTVTRDTITALRINTVAIKHKVNEIQEIEGVEGRVF